MLLALLWVDADLRPQHGSTWGVRLTGTQLRKSVVGDLRTGSALFREIPAPVLMAGWCEFNSGE